MVDRALTTTGPVRTCVGCRRRAAVADLIRFAAVVSADPITEAVTTTVTLDRASDLGGRGAWLHPDRECLRSAVRRRAFIPALRAPDARVDESVLGDEIDAVLADREGRPAADGGRGESRADRPTTGQVAEDMSTP
ncbi:YlxR family protein [Williamsia deligens]|uniref:YlxR family protein n=1 Tax=Williamsia deligens TaxID=321325 RepID=A0ABW3GBF8_9NOCA|nr:YlxR family protein [Williamsia deligens]